jgi:hypothetical protein
MKNTVLNKLNAFGAFALLAVGCFSAQAETRVIANVPFDFMVRNQQFAAGSYTMIVDITKSTVLVRGAEDAVFSLSTATTRASHGDLGAKLVFNRYTDRYFLSEVWPAGRDDGRELLPCDAEVELARNGAKPEIVALLISPGRPHVPAH